MGLLRVDGKRGSLQSHGSTSQSKLREAIHAFHVFFVDVRQRIKILHFASNLTGIRTGIKTGNTANTTCALQQGSPCGLHPYPHRGHEAHTGHDDPPAYTVLSACHSRTTPVCTAHL
jgi:hypothetical protein